MATAYAATLNGGEQSPTLVGYNSVKFSFTVPAAGFVINDTITLAPIPAGAQLDDFFIDMPQLDSNVSPTLTIDIGTDLAASGSKGGVGAAGFHAAGAVGTASTQDFFWGALAVNGTSIIASYVHGSLPFIYLPTEPASQGVLPPVCNLQMKIHAAPATSATSGTISGYIRYNMVTDTTTAGGFL